MKQATIHRHGKLQRPEIEICPKYTIDRLGRDLVAEELERRLRL